MTAPCLRDALHDRITRQGDDGGQTLALALRGDVPLLDALNARVVRTMPAQGLFMRQRPDFFSGVLDAGGAVVMVRQAQDTVAYAVCLPVCAAFPAFHETGGVDGLLFGAAILPEARGRGLQGRLIELRCAALMACGYGAIQATVSPGNHRSVINLVNAGFGVVAVRDMLDGFPRFVIERRREGAAPAAENDLTREPLPPLGTLDAHARRLARGEHAVRASRAPDPALYYTPARRRSAS